MISDQTSIDFFRKKISGLESKKKYIEAFSLVEKMIESELRLGLPRAKTLQMEICFRIRTANRQAAELLSKGKHKLAIELLRRAKSLAKKISDDQEKMSLKSLVYNSIACVYRENTEVKLAQYYVEKAISLAKLTECTENLGITYLNGASIYAIAKEHLQAKLYAEKAIKLLGTDISNSHNRQNTKKLKEKKALMAFAYFTLGQQETKLGNINNAYQNFNSANKLVTENTESLGTLKIKINNELKNLSQSRAKPLNKRSAHSYYPSMKNTNDLCTSLATPNTSSNSINRKVFRPTQFVIHRRICSNYNRYLSANEPIERTLQATQRDYAPIELADQSEEPIYPLMSERERKPRTITANRRHQRLGISPKVISVDALYFSNDEALEKTKREITKTKFKQKKFDNEVMNPDNHKYELEDYGKQSNEEVKESDLLRWSDQESRSSSMNRGRIITETNERTDSHIKNYPLIIPLGKDTNWSNSESTPLYGVRNSGLRNYTNGRKNNTQVEMMRVNKKKLKTQNKIGETKVELQNSEELYSKKSKGIKIWNSQAELKPIKYKVVKLNGKSRRPRINIYEINNTNKKNIISIDKIRNSLQNENEIKDYIKVNPSEKKNIHPKIYIQFKKEEFPDENTKTKPNIASTPTCSTVKQPLGTKPKLEEKKSVIIRSSNKTFSHFLSLADIRAPKPTDSPSQDNYDPDKEKLADITDKAIKLQTAYRSYRERQKYKQHKEHQFSNRKVLVLKAFYDIAKNSSVKAIISIYIVQVTDVELIFTDFKTKDVAHRWKGKCDCPLDATIIKLCWEEIAKESKGNSGNDSKELVKRIQTMSYKNIAFHIEDQDELQNDSPISNIEVKQDIVETQQDNILVSAIKQTNSSIHEIMPGNFTLLDMQKSSITVEVKHDISLAPDNKSSSIIPEAKYDDLLIPEIKRKSATTKHKQQNTSVINIKSPTELSEHEGLISITPIPEMKKESSVLINPKFETNRVTSVLVSPIAKRRRLSIKPENYFHVKSEATNSFVSGFSRRSHNKTKHFASAEISMASISESALSPDEPPSVVRIQRWYRAMLLCDRVNFNPRDLYTIIMRRNAKISVDYNECTGEQKEVFIRIFYVQKKETDIIELFVVDKKTNKRYKPTFTLQKGITNKALKILNNQMVVEMQKDGTGILKVNMNIQIEPWVRAIDSKEVAKSEGAEVINMPEESEPEILQKKWEDKMALVIQAYFRKLKKCVNIKQDLSTIGRNEHIIMNCGRIVSGKAVVIKMFYLEETKRVRIMLFEKVTKRTQVFILDNVNLDEVNHNELVASAWKIVEKIEYDKVTQKFLIGLEQAENKDQSIGVFSVPQREIVKTKKQQSQKNFEALISHEIYSVTRKIGNEHFNVKIGINRDKKAEIYIMKERESLRQKIEVETDLSEFFRLQPKEELITKLGRMIHNEIQATPKGEIYFDEGQFREEILRLVFTERNAKLKKIQKKYRSYRLQSKFISVVAKATTARILVTKFGLKMGKQYHFIKVFAEWNKAGALAIKSNKAKNELKVKIENLDLNKDDDLSIIKQRIKAKLIKNLAFNPSKMNLVFFRNGNNSVFIDNLSY